MWLAFPASEEIPRGESDKSDADEAGGDRDPGDRPFAQSPPGGREDSRRR